MTARTGKKPLDTEINLVPFIDLMAVTIAFLLITTVWTRTGSLPVSESGFRAANVTGISVTPSS